VLLAIAGVLFGIELFYFDGVVLYAFSIVIVLPLVTSGKMNKPWRVFLQDKRGLRVLAAWALMFMFLIGAIFLNEARVEAQGRTIAEACWRYRQSASRFPSRLADLVPSYLPAVPRGKWAADSRWEYWPQKTAATDQYPVLVLRSSWYPGFRTFDFTTNTLSSGPSW